MAIQHLSVLHDDGQFFGFQQYGRCFLCPQNGISLHIERKHDDFLMFWDLKFWNRIRNPCAEQNFAQLYCLFTHIKWCWFDCNIRWKTNGKLMILQKKFLILNKFPDTHTFTHHQLTLAWLLVFSCLETHTHTWTGCSDNTWTQPFYWSKLGDLKKVHPHGLDASENISLHFNCFGKKLTSFSIAFYTFESFIRQADSDFSVLSRRSFSPYPSYLFLITDIYRPGVFTKGFCYLCFSLACWLVDFSRRE